MTARKITRRGPGREFEPEFWARVSPKTLEWTHVESELSQDDVERG